MTTRTGWHACPGGCSAQVPNERFACPDDWSRLPQDIRDEIMQTVRLATLAVRRRAALEAALGYYRLNPAPPGAVAVCKGCRREIKRNATGKPAWIGADGVKSCTVDRAGHRP